MSEKILPSRLVCKHDTEENWKKATNFSPKQAELIIYDIDENHDYERFKIGDGETNVNDLPFADAAMAAAIQAHVDNDTVHHSHDNKTILDLINNEKTTLWDSAVEHISDEVKHITSDERINWNTAKTHADSAHAPSNAQKNSDITKAEIEAKLTGSIDSHTHNIVSTTADGFAPKRDGSTTKFLRGDGTWAVPTDNKVTQTATEPSSNAKWYPVCSTSSSNNTSSTVKNAAFNVNVMEGTTSADGKVELILGNSTPTGTAGNKTGSMTFWTSGSSYIYLKPEKTNSSKTITIPAIAGTLGMQPTINGTFATTLTPADNTVYAWTMTGNLTINAKDYTVCTYYGSHIILTTGSAARTLTINAVAVSGDVATTLPANTCWELSVLRGRVIMAQTV